MAFLNFQKIVIDTFGEKKEYNFHGNKVALVPLIQEADERGVVIVSSCSRTQMTLTHLVTDDELFEDLKASLISKHLENPIVADSIQKMKSLINKEVNKAAGFFIDVKQKKYAL